MSVIHRKLDALRLAVDTDFVRHCRAMSHDEPSSSDLPPDFTQTGKVALVTGAARGIGRASAIADVVLGMRDVNATSDLPKVIVATADSQPPTANSLSWLHRCSVAE